MQDSTRACIVTAYAPNTSHGVYSSGSPYKLGQRRLLESLNLHGFRHKVLAFSDFPNDEFDKSNPYNIKASAMFEARKKGFDVLLWLDCSVWAIKPLEPLFDYISEHGWYFHSNGFDLGQTMDDRALAYFEIDREEAFNMPDLSSSMFGLHLGNPKGEHTLIDWLQSAKDGLWGSSRQHNGGSSHPRFRFDRQDQSCLTALMHKRKMDMLPRGYFSNIAKDNANLNGHDEPIIEEVKTIVRMLPEGKAREKGIALLNSLNGYSETCSLIMRGM